MAKFAVIETGGKQYKVSAGDKIKIEKVGVAAGNFVFDRVLLTADGDSVKIGTPCVSGAEVRAEILREFRSEKKIIFKYHSKTRYRKKKGHRQKHAELRIVSL